MIDSTSNARRCDWRYAADTSGLIVLTSLVIELIVERNAKSDWKQPLRGEISFDTTLRVVQGSIKNDAS